MKTMSGKYQQFNGLWHWDEKSIVWSEGKYLKKKRSSTVKS
jgi:hypothetical protein